MQPPSDLLHSMPGKIEERLPVGVDVRAQPGGLGQMPVQFQPQNRHGSGAGVEARPEQILKKSCGHAEPVWGATNDYANKKSEMC